MLNKNVTERTQDQEEENRKILIVDDEDMTRLLLRRVLERINIPSAHIIEAEDGHSALDLIQTHWPALILLDLRLPKMDGYAVCQQLQQFEGYDPHIIVLTVKGSWVDSSHISDLRVTSYMTKPFNPTLLSETLTEIWYGNA